MPNVMIVIGLGFGDEGKGTTVDHLVRAHSADLVVRFNGGAQAAHNVVTDDGRHHTFAQFGSGTFVPGVKTLLGPDVVFDPFALENEEHALRQVGVLDGFNRMLLDENCLIATPYHQAANRQKELDRGAARHGSCGMGVGETVEYEARWAGAALRVKDLLVTPEVALNKLHLTRVRIAEGAARDILPEQLYDRMKRIINAVTVVDYRGVLSRAAAPVFEGAQGFLLDQHYGFPPHQTRSNCGFDNALQMLENAGLDLSEARRIGVLRSYTTRHGAGPLPTAGSFEQADSHNGHGEWQGAFRTGLFDLVLAQYASWASGATELAATHLDVRTREHCSEYTDAAWLEDALRDSRARNRALQRSLGQRLGELEPLFKQDADRDFTTMLEEEIGLPVSIRSSGPTAKDKAGR